MEVQRTTSEAIRTLRDAYKDSVINKEWIGVTFADFTPEQILELQAIAHTNVSMLLQLYMHAQLWQNATHVYGKDPYAEPTEDEETVYIPVSTRYTTTLSTEKEDHSG